MSPDRLSLRGGYRTSEEQRLIAKLRRDGLIADGVCLNGRLHGPATNGVRCARCAETHRRTATKSPAATRAA